MSELLFNEHGITVTSTTITVNDPSQGIIEYNIEGVASVRIVPRVTVGWTTFGCIMGFCSIPLFGIGFIGIGACLYVHHLYKDMHGVFILPHLEEENWWSKYTDSICLNNELSLAAAEQLTSVVSQVIGQDNNFVQPLNSPVESLTISSPVKKSGWDAGMQNVKEDQKASKSSWAAGMKNIKK